MKKKNLFILIEQANREVDAKLILGLKASQKNYRVIVGHKGTIWSIFKFFNPGIVLLKSFGPKNTKIIDYLKQREFKLVSNDEEIVMQMDMDEAVQRRFDGPNLYKMDHLITNGEKDTNEIKKQFPKFPVNKISQIGNIRFDTMKEPYNKIIYEESKKIKEKYGNFILLATQFGRANAVNTRSHNIDWVFTRLTEDGMDANSKVIMYNKNLILMQREILEKTIEFVLNFEKNFPDKKLVISPHPGEKISFWDNFIKKRNLKNVFINNLNAEPSNRWIAACDYMITSNSTIILEAHLLKKKIINFLPIESYHSTEIDELKDLSITVRSVKELNEIIKSNFKDDPFEPKLNIVDKTITNIKDKKEALENYINVFNDINLVEYNNPFTRNYLSYIFFLKNIFRIIKKKFLKLFKLNITRQDPFLLLLSKIKVGHYLDKKEFINKANFYKDSLKLKNTSVKQIIPQVFIIEKED
tara:strand:+ start:9719 stop:11128 length:1410 start_codon:yes stop_codon:yes gene_type:complete